MQINMYESIAKTIVELVRAIRCRLSMKCCTKDEGCACKSNCRDPQSTDSIV